MADILCFKNDLHAQRNLIDRITSTNEVTDMSKSLIITGGQTGEGKKYATLEPNEWKLDGSFSVVNQYSPMAFWSQYPTDANGKYGNRTIAHKIYLHAAQTKNTIDGITLIFSDSENYSTEITVTLYYNNTSVKSYTLYPTGYIATKSFEDLGEPQTDEDTTGMFDAIRIRYRATNKPYRYVKLADLKLGNALWLSEDKFYDLSVLEDISLASDTLPINTLTFNIDADYSYMQTLRHYRYLELYHHNGQFGTFNIRDIAKQTNDKYQVQAQDIIGILDTTEYSANTFMSTTETSISVADVIDNILADVGVYYVIDDVLKNSTISIKFADTTKRDALAQVLLVSNAVCLKRRNGMLEFKRLDTSTAKANITDRLYADGDVVDTTPVSSLNITTAKLTNGDRASYSTSDFDIIERTKSYIKIRVKLPQFISPDDIQVSFSYKLMFRQNIENQDRPGRYITTVNSPYTVITGVKNFEPNGIQAGEMKYLPDKFSIGTSSVIIQLDRNTISRSKPRVKDNIGGGDIDENILDANKMIVPHLDFTTGELRGTVSITYYKLEIQTNQSVQSVSNNNIPVLAFNAQDLSIKTIDIAALHIDSKDDNTIDLLMGRYFKYNKQYEGTILADGLECGDTVEVELSDLGLVKGTITQLEYNLLTRLVAKAKIWLYYTEE